MMGVAIHVPTSQRGPEEESRDIFTNNRGTSKAVRGKRTCNELSLFTFIGTVTHREGETLKQHAVVTKTRTTLLVPSYLRSFEFAHL